MLGAQGTGLDPAEVQQVGHEAVEAVDLAGHQVEELVARRWIVGSAPSEPGGDGPDRRQRGAQVVRDRPEQEAPLPIHLLKHLHSTRLGGQDLSLLDGALVVGAAYESGHLSLALLGAASTCRLAGDQRSHGHRHEEEDDEPDQVLAQLDPERADGRDERHAVGDRRDEGNGHRDSAAADDRRQADSHDVEQCGRRRRDLAAERQADQRDGEHTRTAGEEPGDRPPCRPDVGARVIGRRLADSELIDVAHAAHPSRCWAIGPSSASSMLTRRRTPRRLAPPGGR